MHHEGPIEKRRISDTVMRYGVSCKFLEDYGLGVFTSPDDDGNYPIKRDTKNSDPRKRFRNYLFSARIIN